MTFFICILVGLECLAVIRIGITTVSPRPSPHLTDLSLSSPFICEEQLSIQIEKFQQCLRHANVLAVSAGEQKTQRSADSIRHHISLHRQPFPDPSSIFVIAPFLAPLTCWCTFTVVLSNISIVLSTSSCAINILNIFFYTPASVHVRKRLHTVFHGP